MRNDSYLRRKNLDPHFFCSDSRYVTNTLHSHRRPVELLCADKQVDDPLTRGITKPYGKTT